MKHKRLDAIEKSASVQSAARLERARQSGDYSQLTDAELLASIEQTQREILAHPAEWAAYCESLAGRIGEHAAGALRELRLADLDMPTLEHALAGFPTTRSTNGCAEPNQNISSFASP